MLTAAQRTAYERDGFIVVPVVFSAFRVSRLNIPELMASIISI